MDSFYSVKGNEVSKENIVAEWINNYTGSLTDFNEGSEIRNLLEAFAVYAMGLEERINDILYVMDIMNADGEYLDLLASQPRIDMERIEGVEATGYVLFTVKNALLEELLIPAGTVVTSDTGLDFETVTDNTILPGELSRECMVQAVDVGVDGNIPAGSIVTKLDGYDAVEGFTVSNVDAFSGGLDYEEDDVFRDRILANMQLAKFGSKPYYVAMLMNEFPEAHDISFDTSDEDYFGVVTPNSYGGTDKQAELEQEVMAYLVDENNVALKHNFNVISPVVKSVDVRFASAGSSDGLYVELLNYETGTVAKAKEVLDGYLKGGSLSFAPVEFKGLNLNEEFSVAMIREHFLSCMSDVFVGVEEVGDVHLFTSENKYGWNYV
jgi:hypothetical protein